MFRDILERIINTPRLTAKPTGPDSSHILFFGLKKFERNRPVYLDEPVSEVLLFEENTLYFVRSIRYEAGKDGAFLLSAEHFEDGMLSVYTYRLGSRAGRRFLKRFPDTEKLRRKFGRMDGGDVFLRYCRKRWFPVVCTTYWC